MKLLSLSLRQFRSFETCDLEFPDGLIGVRGANGSGKTTLAEAIGWALFGKLRPGSKVADAKRQGGQGPSSVELTFRMGPTIYRIERIVGSRASLWIGEAQDPETTQTVATNIAVARELGIGWDSFQRTVFARQRDVAALDPSATKAARTAHVERLLGLKRYREAAMASKDRAKTLADQLAGMREEAPDLAALRAELQLALDAAASGSPAVIDAQQRVGTARKVADDAQAALDAERQRAATDVRLADQLAASQQALDESVADLTARQTRAAIRLEQQQRLATLDAETPDLAAARELRTKWEALHACQVELDELSSGDGDAFDAEQAICTAARLGNVRTQFEELSTAPAPDLVSLSRRVDALAACAGLPPVAEAAAAAESVETAREDAHVRLRALGERIEADLAHLAALEENGADEPCPVCLRPYGDTFDSIRAEHERRITVANQELATLNELCTELDTKHTDAVQLADRTKVAAAALAQTAGADDLADAQAAYEAAEAAATTRASELEALRAERTELERQVAQDAELERAYVAVRAARTAAESRVAGAAAVLGVAKFDPDSLDAARSAAEVAEAIDNEHRELHTALAATQDLASEIAELELRRNRRSEEIARLSAERAELAFMPEQLDSFAAARDTTTAALSRAVEALHEAQLQAQGSDRAVGEASTRLAEAEAIHAKIAEREQEHREQSAATALLTDFRAAQSARAWPNLEQGASVLLSDTTDGRYADVRMSKDYRLEVVDRGERFGLERYSGGEQDLANLCLRLAIADWVARERETELGLVILDEVFGSQDEDRRQRLLEALRVLSNRFHQLLLITHVPEIADLCDHQLVVRLEEPGRSVAELVSA